MLQQMLCPDIILLLNFLTGASGEPLSGQDTKSSDSVASDTTTRLVITDVDHLDGKFFSQGSRPINVPSIQ